MRIFWSRAQTATNLDIEQIVRAHYDDVWRFCARRVGYDLAADAAQDTFITAHQRLASFQSRSTVKTWLLGIALNQCRNSRRKQASQVAEPWLEEGFQGSSPSPESSVLDRVELRKALQKLTPEHREVVLVHEVDGLTYQEAAELLGIPVGTVKSRLHHAFLQLRAALQPHQEAAI